MALEQRREQGEAVERRERLLRPVEVDQDLREMGREAPRLELRVRPPQQRHRLLEAPEPLQQARRSADAGPEQRALAQRGRDAGERLLEPVLLLEHGRALHGDPRTLGTERLGLAEAALGRLEVAKPGGDGRLEREPVGAHLERRAGRQLALAHEAPRRVGAAQRQHGARPVVVGLRVGRVQAVGAQVQREAEAWRAQCHREAAGQDALRRGGPGLEGPTHLRRGPRAQVAPGFHVGPDRIDGHVLRGPPPARPDAGRL